MLMFVASATIDIKENRIDMIYDKLKREKVYVSYIRHESDMATNKDSCTCHV